MNFVRKNATVAVAVLMSLASALALANGPRGDGGKQWQQLNLSASQKEKIEQIEQQYRPAEPPRAQMPSQWREQETQLLQGKSFNESLARQMIQQRQQQHAEFQLQQMKKQHAIFQVLDSKQQQQWLQRKNERAGKEMRKGERRGSMPGN